MIPSPASAQAQPTPPFAFPYFDDARVSSQYLSRPGYDKLTCVSLIAGESTNITRLYSLISTTGSQANGAYYSSYMALIGGPGANMVASADNLWKRTGVAAQESNTFGTRDVMAKQFRSGTMAYYQYLMSFTKTAPEDHLIHSATVAGPVYSYVMP